MKSVNLLGIVSSETRKKFIFSGQMILFILSVITIGAIVIDYGFILDDKEAGIIHRIYHYSWWIYFISYIIQLLFSWRNITTRKILLTVITGIMLFVSAIAKFFDYEKASNIINTQGDFQSENYLTITVIALFSIMELSKAIVRFVNKKTNPALLMAVCFAVIIGFGTLLLLVPRSTHDHIRLHVVDALFTATSAVCVTGLTTVDVAQTFSTEGQIVIALLIQIGGLGVMTITSFFAMFFMGNMGLFNQIALRDMLGTDTFNSLISMLLYILGFTFLIEIVGALCIWISIHSTLGMTIEEEIFFSIFHAVSAFCNAGFSTMTGNLGNPLIMNGHNGFYLVISILIVLGGLGFPILMNFKQVISYNIKKIITPAGRKKKHPRFMHLANINTKLVIASTIVLISVGFTVILINEWDNAFAGMDTPEKIVHSLFNSVSPRTAGFNSVDLTSFSTLTIIIYMVLMWIGGGSQSTAGGIKVNTIAVAFANFVSIIKGRKYIMVFKRELTIESVRRASAVIFGSLITILTFFVLLVIFEPDLPARGLLFETISAFSTVGSSLNITSFLGDDSKVAVSILMFIGRVGMITVLMSIIRPSDSPKYRFPQENIIIN